LLENGNEVYNELNNLISLFQQLAHQKQARFKLSALRFNCFAVGSWLENEVLKMSVPSNEGNGMKAYFCFVENAKLPLKSYW